MSAARRQTQEPKVLYIDSDLLVADKPSGPLLTSGGEENSGLPELLRERAGLCEEEPLFVVHRLHEQASGVTVYARTRSARDKLRKQFVGGQAQVTYIALVTGCVEDQGEIDLRIYYEKRSGCLRASDRRGKPALTSYRIVERVAGNTLIECHSHERHPDQIRCHLAAAGHPLTVDPEFGGGRAVLLSDYKADYRRSTRHEERPLVERLTLHAASVSLVHSTSGLAMEFRAPLPKDLRATLRQLRRLL